MHVVIAYVVGSLLFGLGVYGVLRRRNAILVLMAVELMLNAVNLILITADVSLRSALTGVAIESWARPASAVPGTGGVLALFVIVLAAAEVGVGLAIILQFYRMRNTVVVDDVRLEAEGEQDSGEGREPDQKRDSDEERVAG